MFCQIVEYRLRSQRFREFKRVLRALILPLLRKQPGFVSQSYISAELSREKVLAVTFWRSKRDAERFHWNQHLGVLSLIDEFVSPAPKYEGYEVLGSISSSPITASSRPVLHAAAANDRRLRRGAGECNKSTPMEPRRIEHMRTSEIGANLPPFTEPQESCSPDRRSEERVPIQLPASILSPDGGVEVRTCTKDLSQRGAFLYVSSTVEKGSPLDFVVTLPEEVPCNDRRWLCCHARVIRVERGPIRGLSGVAAAIEHFEVLPQM